MTIQNEMIGQHPENTIGVWLEHEDLDCTELKRHRYLQLISENESEATATIANWLIKYHLSAYRKKTFHRKKEILRKYDYKELINKINVFPDNDKTRKGNFGEVILSEYLSQASGIEILVYKLHYNPNIDQSMKGDDVLLVDEERIILGESKFRSTPNKAAVKEAVENMETTVSLPISLTFLAEKLMENGYEELADWIFDFQIDIITENVDIKNVGFLLSTKNVRETVEKNLSARNKELIFISFGVENPLNFLNKSFEVAEQIMLEEIYEN